MSRDAILAEALEPDDADGPLGPLPRLSARQVRLEARLGRLATGAGISPALDWLVESIGTIIQVNRPEILWRPSGLGRSGMVAQLSWPRLSTRLAFGLETPLAHAIVDRLLGFDRLPAEGRLPPSPVEWGILTFVVAETLRRLAGLVPCPFGLWDPILDRVGPDPFDHSGLGRVVTLRWPLTIGAAEGSLRLWATESLLARWTNLDPGSLADPSRPISHPETLTSVWTADAGTIALPRGLKTLRVGGVLPLIDSRLRGTPQSPTGPVALTLTLSGSSGRFTIDAEPLPQSGGGRLTLTSAPRLEAIPREALAMSVPTPSSASSPDPSQPAAADVPVTLVVELGRVNLPLGRLADLKPGDVVELGRHSREPVELTSGGRLIARGDLVLIDTELGVRVTHLFL